MNSDFAKTPNRYNDKELEEFRVLLEEKLVQARGQLDYYLGLIKESGVSEADKLKGLDDAANSIGAEHIHTLASRQRKLIQHLENAKLRIMNKVYGVCRETGELISKERLRAVPHATLSIKAKTARK